LTRKVRQTGMRSGFISRSVHARLQVHLSIYYLLRQNLLQCKTKTKTKTTKSILEAPRDQDPQDPRTSLLVAHKSASKIPRANALGTLLS